MVTVVALSSQVGYKHFCQKPHCDHTKCKKCILFTDAEHDDRLAVKEAGLAAKKDLLKVPASCR